MNRRDQRGAASRTAIITARRENRYRRESPTQMTLRAIASAGPVRDRAVLIVPLLISLKSLEQLYETSRLLRDREFAASMLLGSFRERTDDARRAEDALLFIHDQKSATRMQRELDGLVALTDSLDRYRLDLSATQIRSSLDALRAAAPRRLRAGIGRPKHSRGDGSQQRSCPRLRPSTARWAPVRSHLRNRTRHALPMRRRDTESRTSGGRRAPDRIGARACHRRLASSSISGPVSKLERASRDCGRRILPTQLDLSPSQEANSGAWQRAIKDGNPLGSGAAPCRVRDVASHELKTPIHVSTISGASSGRDLRGADAQTEGRAADRQQAGASADAPGQAPTRYQQVRSERRKARSARGRTAAVAHHSGELIHGAGESASYRVFGGSPQVPPEVY